jgi:hypothetical protein
MGEFDSEKSELAVAAIELEMIRLITAGNHPGRVECYLPCAVKSITAVASVLEALKLHPTFSRIVWQYAHSENDIPTS